MNIRVLSNTAIPEELMRSIEPHFLYSHTRELSFPPGCSSITLLRYINYKIAQNPAKITNHVRKIKLLQVSDFDSEFLFAALMDLFLLLKNNGLNLRQRMLISSKNHLTKLMFTKLQNYMSKMDVTGADRWISNLSMLPPLMVKEFNVNIVEVSSRPVGGVAFYGL